MKKIYLFTNIAPHYRKPLWKLLLQNPKNEFHFFFGNNSVSGIRPIYFEKHEFESIHNRLHRVKNIWYKGKVLIWQKGIISRCIISKFDIAIFLGEMYCISTWLSAIICRLRGKTVTFWGHGLYGNEGKLKLFVRKIFYRLAHNHLLYGQRAKQLMLQQGFNSNKLFIVFNSLDYDEHKAIRDKYSHLSKEKELTFFKNPLLPALIFIGRLTENKKLDFLIKSVSELNKEKESVNLIIIGDGDERKNLERIGEKGLNNYIHFTGAYYNEQKIGRYLAISDLCVSPGNVGLTAIHSLSFGTPVCTHNNMNNQMPEAEAIYEGYNGFFFEENNVEDLVYRIKSWICINRNRFKIRQNCYKVIDNYYNPYYQLTVFNRLTNRAHPEI